MLLFAQEDIRKEDLLKQTSLFFFPCFKYLYVLYSSETTLEALDERVACISSKPLPFDQYSHKEHRWEKVNGEILAGLCD